MKFFLLDLGGYRRKCSSLLSQESSQCCVGFSVGFYPCKGTLCSGFWCCRTGRWREQGQKKPQMLSLPQPGNPDLPQGCNGVVQILHRPACSQPAAGIAKARLHRFLVDSPEHPQCLPNQLIQSGERTTPPICSRPLRCTPTTHPSAMARDETREWLSTDKFQKWTRLRKWQSAGR